MDTPLWSPPVALSPAEQKVVARAAPRKKLFVFLREIRGESFDEAFQGELLAMYRQTGAGKPPVPPTLLAMATLLQAHTAGLIRVLTYIKCIRARYLYH